MKGNANWIGHILRGGRGRELNVRCVAKKRYKRSEPLMALTDMNKQDIFGWSYENTVLLKTSIKIKTIEES